MPTDDDAVLTDLAEAFRQFATFEAAGLSPLYERLAEAVADDRKLLSLAAAAPREQRRPTLFFAAVHDVVLRLGVLYPGSIDAFRVFAHEHRDELLGLIRTRHTQTNEIARCAQFLPALALIAKRTGRPLGLVELGASAGLNLLLDRFRYRYAGVSGIAAVGDAASPVQLECEVLGRTPPPVPAQIPPIGTRLGIDLVPLDVTDPHQARWLQACVWAEHHDRAERLAAAIALANRHPTRVIRGDAGERLSDAAAEIPRNETLVVFHSSTLPYFSAADHARLRAAIAAMGRERELFWLFSEGPGLVEDLVKVSGIPTPATRYGVLGVVHIANGDRTSEALALTGPHGRWIEWLTT